MSIHVLIAQGLSQREVARRLGISRNTVARHARLSGSRGRSIQRQHLFGGGREPWQPSRVPEAVPAALLRPLADYEALIGGGW